MTFASEVAGDDVGHAVDVGTGELRIPLLTRLPTARRQYELWDDDWTHRSEPATAQSEDQWVGARGKGLGHPDAESGPR